MKIHAIGQIGSSAAERKLMHLGSYLTEYRLLFLVLKHVSLVAVRVRIIHMDK